MRSLRLFPSLRRLSSLSTEIPLRPRKENAEDEHRVFEMPPPTAPSTQPSSPPNPELDLEPNLEPESESSPPTPPSYPTDFASLLTAHPSLATHYNTLSTKASLASAKLQSRAELVKQDTLRNLGLLGRRLNEFTGYDEIERLKEGVKEKENQIADLRATLNTLKSTYLTSVTTRSTSQRELNDLLQRKHLWSTTDVERFTTLVRDDHENTRKEEDSKRTLETAEAEVERGFTEMMNSILNRYHEEQLWSDKLRSFSTYVSLAVMVANLVVFITAIVVVEPWKRKRMVESFERKVEEMRVGIEDRLDRVGAPSSQGDGESLKGIWEELKRLKIERDPPTEPQLSLPSIECPPSPTLPTEPTPPSGRILTFLPEFPFVHLSPQHVPSPSDLLQSSQHTLASTQAFVQTGWDVQGRERDLLVVGAGAAVTGGLIVGLLREFMR